MSTDTLPNKKQDLRHNSTVSLYTIKAIPNFVDGMVESVGTWNKHNCSYEISNQITFNSRHDFIVNFGLHRKQQKRWLWF